MANGHTIFGIWRYSARKMDMITFSFYFIDGQKYPRTSMDGFTCLHLEDRLILRFFEFEILPRQTYRQTDNT